MVSIVQKENEILRQIAREVTPEEIKRPALKKILRGMQVALDSQEDGVAIAAPQIGEPLRIFIVSKRIFEMEERQEEILSGKPKSNEASEVKKEEQKDMIFINPKMIKLSREKKLMEEGCLSVRWVYGKVKRSVKAIIEAQNEKGELIKRGASGLLAQVFQHELDHLEGTLFIDKAVDIKEVKPEGEYA